MVEADASLNDRRPAHVNFYSFGGAIVACTASNACEIRDPEVLKAAKEVLKARQEQQNTTPTETPGVTITEQQVAEMLKIPGPSIPMNRS